MQTYRYKTGTRKGRNDLPELVLFSIAWTSLTLTLTLSVSLSLSLCLSHSLCVSLSVSLSLSSSLSLSVITQAHMTTPQCSLGSGHFSIQLYNVLSCRTILLLTSDFGQRFRTRSRALIPASSTACSEAARGLQWLGFRV